MLGSAVRLSCLKSEPSKANPSVDVLVSLSGWRPASLRRCKTLGKTFRSCLFGQMCQPLVATFVAALGRMPSGPRWHVRSGGSRPWVGAHRYVADCKPNASPGAQHLHTLNLSPRNLTRPLASCGSKSGGQGPIQLFCELQFFASNS